MPTRQDLENDNNLRGRVHRALKDWGIARIAKGGKIDGIGYGSMIHDSYGPECGEALWVKDAVEFQVIDGLSVQGKQGWRMPTRAELVEDDDLRNRVIDSSPEWAIL